MVYNWDCNCQRLTESIRGRFQHVARECDELARQDAWDTVSLLNYYKKWHYNRELFHLTIDETGRRQYVMDSLGNRGYGVNRDLQGALGAVRNEYGYLHRALDERFRRQTELAKRLTWLPQERVDARDSFYIIIQLCGKLNWNPRENIPTATQGVYMALDHYYRVLGETPWHVNNAIFQKLFLDIGNSSMTITKGSMGQKNLLPPADLKNIGNRNLLSMSEEVFSNLSGFTAIGLDLLKRINWVLSRDIVAGAGNFRNFDFPDKNGVTVEHGNLWREMGCFAHVLWETGQSFQNLYAFIYNLARSYYMLIGIHPFVDSNGRVGRCFLDYMLLKKGIPPLSYSYEEETNALPRYGGNMEEMHDYIKASIMRSVDSYFYERWKLENFGFESKRIYNVSYDSAVHFRQIDDRPRKIEVNFQAYLMDDNHPLSREYQNQCKVVLPNEHLVYNMTVYCGFSRGYRGEWEQVFGRKNDFYIKEIRSDLPGVRIFDADFVVELQGPHYNYDFFSCCVVSHEGGRIFNNKGLNYTYRIRR